MIETTIYYFVTIPIVYYLFKKGIKVLMEDVLIGSAHIVAYLIKCYKNARKWYRNRKKR